MASRVNDSALLKLFDIASGNNHLADFLTLDIRTFERLLREKDEQFWQRKGEERALTLFHAAARRIPAYRDFLRKHRIQAERIRTIRDFPFVPIMDKKNYIQQYPLADRSWDGVLNKHAIIAVSSGTGGEPTPWMRGTLQEFEQGIIHEWLYRFLFDVHKYRTLLVIGFPMGIYVSGMATALPSILAASKGYPLTVAAIGNNKDHILRVIQHIGKDYDQIVLAGHPFFIKDVIESGKRIDVWSKKKVRMLFCSEGFSEVWRRYVAEQAGMTPDLRSMISVYGASDLLLIGYETPLSIFVHACAEENVSLRGKLIRAPSTPHLFQYNPFLRYIETTGNELLFTSASGIPLIRFNLHDAGSIISCNDALDALTEYMPGWKKVFRANGGGTAIWHLPLLALYGRNDQTVIFHAVNIYPDHVRIALDHPAFFPYVTGRFTLQKRYTKRMDAILELHIELQIGVKSRLSLERLIRDHFVKRLREINTEYSDAIAHVKKDLRPHIKLWPYQHPRYFRKGIKHRAIADDEE